MLSTNLIAKDKEKDKEKRDTKEMQKCRNDKKELFNDQPFQGGYDFLFIEAMKNTVQTVSGHRFCEECLEYTLRKFSFTLLLCSFFKNNWYNVF